MYPDLSYIFHAIFGTSPDNWISIFKTFGLFLVFAILTASYILYRGLKRMAKENKFNADKVKYTIGEPPKVNELIGTGVWGFLIAYKGWYAIQNFDALKRDPSDVLLSINGSWLAGLLLAALLVGLKYLDVKKKQLPKPKVKIKKIYPHDRIGDITIIAAISGVVGAKLFAVIEDIPALLADPLGTLLSGGGLAIYGGLIGGFIGVYIYLRKNGIPPIHVLDAVAPALIIAYGIGRLGCHFSGDGDWGIVNAAASPSWWFLPEWMWAFDYPHNVIREGIPLEGCDLRYCTHLSPPVYPTSIYEFLMTLVIAGILFSLRKPLITYPGILFFIYLIFNGLERFFIETIRVNQVYTTLGIGYTQAQFIAVILLLIGLVGSLIIWQKGQKNVKG